MLATVTLSLFVALQRSSDSLADKILAWDIDAQLLTGALPSFLRSMRRRAHQTVPATYTCTWPPVEEIASTSTASIAKFLGRRAETAIRPLIG